MTIVKNRTIEGAAGKPILLDILYKDKGPLPVVIYAHGFNGFKDWGHFDLIAKQFAEAGFVLSNSISHTAALHRSIPKNLWTPKLMATTIIQKSFTICRR